MSTPTFNGETMTTVRPQKIIEAFNTEPHIQLHGYEIETITRWLLSLNHETTETAVREQSEDWATITYQVARGEFATRFEAFYYNLTGTCLTTPAPQRSTVLDMFAPGNYDTGQVPIIEETSPHGLATLTARGDRKVVKLARRVKAKLTSAA